jgi:hypothetical protein
MEAGVSATPILVVILHPHRDPHWTKMSIEGFTSQLAKLDRRFGGPA